MTIPLKIEHLINSGVDIPCPSSVVIDNEVNSERISSKAVCIHAGCRISGPQTFIAEGARIGTEGPAIIENCFIGPEVELKSGFFKNAVFLEKASLGSGSHVREGTILEEQASTAHCVGLKQTILLPFVTLGSLINFCDCLMAGGTSRKNHSEVGSSFIHFNYTPNQDKATPSLLGDVPSGVMMNQRPIFLGGQGGLVGPCRIAYGTVSAAGTIIRKDQLNPDHLIVGGAGKGGTIPWKSGTLGGASRIIRSNLNYIANLYALREWYDHVRSQFINHRFPKPLLQGLKTTLAFGIDERLKRLGGYIEKLGERRRLDQFDGFQTHLQHRARELGVLEYRDRFLGQLKVKEHAHDDYLATIKGLPRNITDIGTHWLESIVNQVLSEGETVLNQEPSD